VNHRTVARVNPQFDLEPETGMTARIRCSLHFVNSEVLKFQGISSLTWGRAAESSRPRTAILRTTILIGGEREELYPME
jgi:hypothetical protein